eukprot:scaffold87866_cov62-Phaeocystis_antarctica.AAC.1
MNTAPCAACLSGVLCFWDLETAAAALPRRSEARLPAQTRRSACPTTESAMEYVFTQHSVPLVVWHAPLLVRLPRAGPRLSGPVTLWLLLAVLRVRAHTPVGIGADCWSGSHGYATEKQKAQHRAFPRGPPPQ